MNHLHKLVLVIAVLLTTAAAIAQQARTAEEEASYTKSINQRAEKIVRTLAITDGAKAVRVRDIIAKQYRNLSEIHDASEAKIKLVENSETKKE